MNSTIERFIAMNVPAAQRTGGLIQLTEQQLESYTWAVLLDAMKHVHWCSIDTHDIDRSESMDAAKFYIRSDYGIPTWLRGEEHYGPY